MSSISHHKIEQLVLNIFCHILHLQKILNSFASVFDDRRQIFIPISEFNDGHKPCATRNNKSSTMRKTII